MEELAEAVASEEDLPVGEREFAQELERLGRELKSLGSPFGDQSLALGCYRGLVPGHVLNGLLEGLGHAHGLVEGEIEGGRVLEGRSGFEFGFEHRRVRLPAHLPPGCDPDLHVPAAPMMGRDLDLASRLSERALALCRRHDHVSGLGPRLAHEEGSRRVMAV